MALAPLKGLVLAGGRSRRMGVDKAGLQIDGQSLLDRSVTALQSAIADVRVAIGSSQLDDGLRSNYPVVVDQLQNIGPAAGILAAHLLEPASAWLIIGCDMPMLEGGTLARLVAARDPDAEATALMAAGRGRAEPLCAIYEPVTLAAFLQQVDAGGSPSPSRWLASARVKMLAVPDALLASANTREELEQMRNHLLQMDRIADRKL